MIFVLCPSVVEHPTVFQNMSFVFLVAENLVLGTISYLLFYIGKNICVF